MDASFSHVTREADLQAMASQPVDVLVVGGGVIGAGIARDAAHRGIRTALIGQGDFGNGGSVPLPQPLHGGILYVEHENWHLSLETSKERRLLLRLAPHLVRPLEFLLPLYDADPRPIWKTVTGIALYDLFAFFQNVRTHRWLGKRAVLGREPSLRPQGLRGGATFWTAVGSELRLAVAAARSARAAGALVANHVAVVSLDRAGAHLSGAHVRDETTGLTFTIRALRVVAAGGAEVDTMRRLDDAAAAPLTEAVRSSYVVVPSHRLSHHHPIMLTSPIDGRVLWVVPWAHASAIGTAESVIPDPADSARAPRGDVLYLLRSANALFPAARLTMQDVLSAWSRIDAMPLPSLDPPAVRTRSGWVVEDRPSGLLSVVGAHLASSRAAAEYVTDHLARALIAIDGRPPPKRCATRSEPLPGGEVADLAIFMHELTVAGAPADLAAHLVNTYGTEAPAVLKLIERDRQLGLQLVPGLPTVWAEVMHSIRREMAMTVTDLLAGRTPLLLHDQEHAVRQAPLVARRLSSELGWSPERERDALGHYLALAESTVSFNVE